MLNTPNCVLKDFNCSVKLRRLENTYYLKRGIKDNINSKLSDGWLRSLKVPENMWQIQKCPLGLRRSERCNQIKKEDAKTEDMELDLETNTDKPYSKVKEIKEEIEDMEEENESKNTEGEGLSPYERMILKNREEKFAFLQSLKIDEAKAGFVEAVNTVRKKPKVQKKIYIKKIYPAVPVRKSKRLAKIDVDLSEEALYSKALLEAAVENKRKVLPPILPFEDAMQFKELYQNYLDDFDFKNDTERRPGTQIYNKAVFKRMVIDESRIAKVVPSRVSAMALHPTCEKTVVCAGSKFGNLGIWNVDCDSSPYVFGPHDGLISNIQFNLNKSNQCVSSSYDGTLRCADFETKIFTEVYNISEETSCTYFDFLSPVTLLVSQRNGKVSLVDNRAEGKRCEKQHQCHDYTIKTVHVHPVNKNYFVTAENRGAVHIWDLRKLQQKPVVAINHHKRSVNSAYFSPVTGNSILTTSADDSICIFDSSILSGEMKLKKSLRHNNLTGRWLSVFRATWIPNTDDIFVVGSMLYPRRIEIFNAEGCTVHEYNDEYLTTVTSVNVFHPFQSVLAAGNSSGKVYVFKEVQS